MRRKYRWLILATATISLLGVLGSGAGSPTVAATRANPSYSTLADALSLFFRNPPPTISPMFRTVRIANLNHPGFQRAARAYQVAAAQPSWITRLALFTFLLVIGLPLMLLFLFALLTATVVFGTLALGHLMILKLKGLMPVQNGRENVTIIRREPPQ